MTPQPDPASWLLVLDLVAAGIAALPYRRTAAVRAEYLDSLERSVHLRGQGCHPVKGLLPTSVNEQQENCCGESPDQVHERPAGTPFAWAPKPVLAVSRDAAEDAEQPTPAGLAAANRTTGTTLRHGAPASHQDTVDNTADPGRSLPRSGMPSTAPTLPCPPPRSVKGRSSMRYSVTKKIGPISSMHAILGLPEGHECRNMHGHNLYVELTIGADELTGPGFVIDFNDLASLEAYVASWSRLESLNTLFPQDMDPTVEVLAEHIADWYQTNVEPDANGWLTSVTVHENETCSATFTPTSGSGGPR